MEMTSGTEVMWELGMGRSNLELCPKLLSHSLIYIVYGS